MHVTYTYIYTRIELATSCANRRKNDAVTMMATGWVVGVVVCACVEVKKCKGNLYTRGRFRV